MPKLLLLWNVIPDRQEEFEEALERMLSSLGSFPGIGGISFSVAMPSSRTFPSFLGVPKYGCMAEIELRSANTLLHLWSDPEYRSLIEEFMDTVEDFTSLGFQRAVYAKDIMSTEVITISPEASFQDLVELLARHRISGVPVVDQGRVLMGIVTEADVLARVGNTVADIMTREVISVSEDTSIEDIARILTLNKIRRVPVMKGGQLVGIVSREDMIRAMASL